MLLDDEQDSLYSKRREHAQYVNKVEAQCCEMFPPASERRQNIIPCGQSFTWSLRSTKMVFYTTTWTPQRATTETVAWECQTRAISTCVV